MTSGLIPGRSSGTRTSGALSLSDMRAFSRTFIEKLIDFLFGPPPLKPIPVKTRDGRRR
jgi:hypothetical protein